MGHYCRICGQMRPNEKFSGKGHKNHICKDCSRIPEEEIVLIDLEDEIYKYLKQSNISNENIKRLKELTLHKNNNISEHASIVLEVAKVKPHKKRRLKVLAQKRRDLLLKLQETGLINAHHS
jgi:hypothetical protein